MLEISQARLRVGVYLLLMIGLSPIARAQFNCDDSACCDSACCDAAACAPSTAWSFGAKALFLDRADDNARIFTGANGNFDADEFGLGFQAGYQINGRRALNECNDLTVRWMSVDRWRDDHRDLVGAGSAAILNSAAPFTAPGVTGVDGVHTSELHSFELGISHQWFDDVRLTGGFRFLEISDSNAFALDAAAATTTLLSRARNRLYGGQIGVESTLLRNGNWTVDGLAQIGIFGNDAKAASQLDTGAVAIATTGTGTEFSFLAELGGQVRRGVTSNLDFVAGYQLMWVTSVADASDQLLASNFILGTGFDASSTAFYHGASVGFEFRK